MKSAEQLDSNFQLPPLEGEWEWHDPAAWPLQAAGWSEGIERWTRLPDSARPQVTPDVWALSRHSAGLYLEFTTDSPAVAARWRLAHSKLALNHMASTGVSGLDLYQWTDAGWRFAGVGRPVEIHNQSQLLARDPGGPVRYRLYLPLYNQLAELEIALRPGSSLELHAPTKPPVCVYGTSIVQGGCASRPGMAYPAIMGRQLDCPVINLGFSGNGRAEPLLAEVLGSLRPSVFVIDCLPNLQPDSARENLSQFLPRLLELTGETPFICVEFLNVLPPELTRSKKDGIAEKNALQREIIASCDAAYPGRITTLPGEALLGTDGEATVDGVHPTDLGFQRMAAGIAPAVRAVLG